MMMWSDLEGRDASHPEPGGEGLHERVAPGEGQPVAWPGAHHDQDQDHRLTVGLPHVLHLLVLAPVRGHEDHLHGASAALLARAGVGPETPGLLQSPRVGAHRARTGVNCLQGGHQWAEK